MKNRDKNDEATRPPGKRPDPPPMPPKRKLSDDISKEWLIKIFNEWNKRYSKNPDDFSDSLDENGNPIEDYGECCAVYFQKISYELEKITVCDKCFQASCWQGMFMCAESRDAGTIQKTRKELIELKLENSDWWLTDDQLADQ